MPSGLITAEQYIEKYIELIDDENWKVFWEGCWYYCNNRETNKLLTLLESIGISKTSSKEIREDLYSQWLGSLLDVCPLQKEVAILLYSDMRNDFGLSEDECFDLFLTELDKRRDFLELINDDQIIKRKK